MATKISGSWGGGWRAVARRQPSKPAAFARLQPILSGPRRVCAAAPVPLSAWLPTHWQIIRINVNYWRDCRAGTSRAAQWSPEDTVGRRPISPLRSLTTVGSLGRVAGVVDPTLPRLTEAEIAAFRRDGLVLPRAGLAAFRLAELGAIVEAAMRSDAPAGTEDVALRAWAHRVTLSTVVEPLLGPDAVLWDAALRDGAARDAADGSWHQDAADRAPASPAHDGVSVRVALDSVDRATGWLRLLPRPHERLVRELRNARDRAAMVLPADAVDPAIVVVAIRAAGELVLHDRRTLYSEPASRTGRRRAAVVFRYRAAAAAR